MSNFCLSIVGTVGIVVAHIVVAVDVAACVVDHIEVAVAAAAVEGRRIGPRQVVLAGIVENIEVAAVEVVVAWVDVAAAVVAVECDEEMFGMDADEERELVETEMVLVAVAVACTPLPAVVRDSSSPHQYSPSTMRLYCLPVRRPGYCPSDSS